MSARLYSDNKQQLESPQNSIIMPTETVFPTSTPSDCAMEGSTPVMSRQNSTTTQNSSYSLMQETPSKDPPAYYDHMVETFVNF